MLDIRHPSHGWSAATRRGRSSRRGRMEPPTQSSSKSRRVSRIHGVAQIEQLHSEPAVAITSGLLQQCTSKTRLDGHSGSADQRSTIYLRRPDRRKRCDRRQPWCIRSGTGRQGQAPGNFARPDHPHLCDSSQKSASPPSCDNGTAFGRFSPGGQCDVDPPGAADSTAAGSTIDTSHALEILRSDRRKSLTQA